VPFIPALYRQLAHWPPVLEWLADELGPRFDASETAAARSAFQEAARAAAADIVARLPAPAPAASPDVATTHRIVGAIARYAETSPEMTMFGQLILDAFTATPGPADRAPSRRSG
jgi:chaperone required for assembly of F1-ATPase